MSITVDLNALSVNYTENQGNLTLFDSAIFFSDEDSLVDTLTITLDGALPTEFLSVLFLPTGYLSSYDSNTGLLTISSDTGDISDANWQSVLRSVQYNNSSNNPPGTRELTVIASDTIGAETSNSAAVTYTIAIAAVNNAPTGAVTISGNVQENATLTANVDNIADDDGLGAFSYQWFRDNVMISSATNSTYILEDTDVGKQISVEVSYIDGQGTAESLTSAQTAAVTNVNNAPTGAVTISGNVQENA
ncbi:MAG: hypothetical protein KA520_09015, partial [Nitrosomonas sp.]|nr:hypothetical protein [Nitrosomonas sp.]